VKKTTRVRPLTKLTLTFEDLRVVLDAARREGYNKRLAEEAQERRFAEISYTDRTPNDPLTLTKWWGNHTGDTPLPIHRFTFTP
jgi:hypothetical protein